MSRYTLKVNEHDYTAEVKELTAEKALIQVDGIDYTVDLVEFGRREESPKTRVAATPAPNAPATAPRPEPTRTPHATAGAVTAPLPGLVLQLKVKEGDAVSAGQLVLVMEAMKMENEITSPHTGTVKKIFIAEGDSVGEGDPLVEISRPEMTTL